MKLGVVAMCGIAIAVVTPATALPARSMILV
jgi:hypothetical protein